MARSLKRRTTAASLLAAGAAALIGLSFVGAGSATSLSASRSLYLSPNGSDANACTAVAPCKTLDRAYHAAAPGDSVEVGAGIYPAQTISLDSTKAAATQDVVFGSSGGVSLGYLTVNATHLTISGLTINGWKIGTTADHVTMLGNTSTREITTTGAHNVLVKGGQVYSPTLVTSDPQISAYRSAIPTNVTYDGVWFHDFVDTVPGLHHIECLQVGAGVNLTIKNSRFGPNCDTHDLFIRSWGNTMNGGPHPLDVQLTGNTFLPCRPGCYSLMADDDLYTLTKTNLVVAGNTFAPATNWSFDWEHGSAAFYANILATTTTFGCGYKATAASQPPSSFFHDNLFYGAGVGCGVNAKVIPSSAGLWRGNGDYHLAAASPALDLFAVGPVDDMDGDLRPLGARYDAGADEATAADRTPPTLANVPANRTVEATNAAGAPVTYPTPTATDNLDTQPTVTCSPPSGTTFVLGSTTVRCTATDASGNSSSAMFVVTVLDTTAPSVPSGWTATTALQTGYTLAWQPSSDAVGVTGYDVFVDGLQVGSTAAAQLTVGGLACGTTHTVAVAAHDAAGNESARLGTSAATASCSPVAPSLQGVVPKQIGFVDTHPSTMTASDTIALSAVAAGETVIVVVGGNVKAPAAVHDGGGNAYSLNGASGAASAYSTIAIYRFRYATAQAGVTLTVDWAAPLSIHQAVVYAIPNLVASPLDSTAVAGAFDTAPRVSSPASALPNELALAAFRITDATWSGSGWAPSGWTSLADALPPAGGNGHLMVAYRYVPFPAALSAAYSVGATPKYWSAALVSYVGN